MRHLHAPRCQGESPGAKGLRANLRRFPEGHDLLAAEALRNGVDVLIVSEQNQRRNLPRSTPDLGGCAVIQIMNSAVCKTEKPVSGHGFARKVVKGVAVYSCYYSPNAPLQVFSRELKELEDSARQWRGLKIVAGDFNAKSPGWSGGPEDTRGVALADTMNLLDLVLVNQVGHATFDRGGSSSVLDLTFVSPTLIGRVGLNGPGR